MEGFKILIGDGSGQKIFRGYAEDILPRLPRSQTFDIVYLDALRPPPEEKYKKAHQIKNTEIALLAALRVKIGFIIIQGERIDGLITQLLDMFSVQYLGDFACIYPLRPLKSEYEEVPQISDRIVILGTYGLKLGKPYCYTPSDFEVKRLYPKQQDGKMYYVERGQKRFYEGEKIPATTSVFQSENEKLDDVFSNKTKSELFYYRLFSLVNRANANKLLIIHFGSGAPILAAEKMGLNWTAIGSFQPAIDGVVERLRRLAEEKSIFGSKPHGKPARAFSVLALNDAQSPETDILPS